MPSCDDASARLSWDDLVFDEIARLITMARDEDLGGRGLKKGPAAHGDVSSALISPTVAGEIELRARETLTVCGLPLGQAILDAYGDGLKFSPAAKDGDRIDSGAILAEITGPAHLFLQAERVLLNFLQKLSGIATQTATYVDALGDSRTRLLDTRKTTPGWRMLEKVAVAMGGGWNHRLGLFDRVMLKDNHLAAGDFPEGNRLAEAVQAAKERNPDLLIEVEVDRIDQIPPILEAGAHIILLDNFGIEELKAAVALVDGRALTEASGGITIESLHRLATLGLDFVSTGALIHRARWVDIGADWR